MVVSTLDHCAQRFDRDCRQLGAAASGMDHRDDVHSHCRLVAAVSGACAQGLSGGSALIRESV